MRAPLVLAALVAACNGSAPTDKVGHPAAGSNAPAGAAASTAMLPSKAGSLVEGATVVRPHREEPVVECPAVIPENADDDARVAALLDEANKQIERAQYGAAWTCADRAGDLSPTSVEAQHLRGAALAALGLDYNYTIDRVDAWMTVLVMDVWHWTPLVALLCYSGLRAIPPAYYQAAAIDGASAWSVFRYIQLPKLRNVLVIAVLLRFMDSFMIYTEPFVVTGGGPGNSTTFLSQLLTTRAVGQFDLGSAAAFSLIYFIFILFFCYVFYTVLNRVGQG
jgi:hypothetical protein